tara:strand:- start:4056 stop:4805 length:750 start_codon:yes stop_codon:yes gene_type:complete
MANLINCTIRNHRSTEYYLDQVGIGSIPNIVLIEVFVNLATQFDPPTYSETGDGFWMVKAIDFNIGGSTSVSPIYPSEIWSDGISVIPQTCTYDDPNDCGYAPGSGYQAAPNDAYIGPVPGAGFNTYGLSVGKHYTQATVSNSSFDENGVDIGTQSGAAWDDKVSDIMIVDNVSGMLGWDDVESTSDSGVATTTGTYIPGKGLPLIPIADQQKNRILVFVRLKSEFVFPAENVTIDVDIRGEAKWIDLW